jgi:hypothetical protein
MKQKKMLHETFCFYFFSLGFSLDFSIQKVKVGFVVIILCIKCPLRVEFVSDFFSEAEKRHQKEL